MKVLILGLDCAAPELVFDRFREDLPNLRALIKSGAHGPMQSIIPPITVPAWACMMTGHSPGALGVYGFRNRSDYSYDNLSIASSASIREKTIWDYLSAAGRSSVVIGVPPSYPPKPLNGCLVSCFLTPGPETIYTHPPVLKAELEKRVGEYLFDVSDFRTEDKKALLQRIYDMSAQRFEVIEYMMASRRWDFFAAVDMGLDRLHHGFWKYFDPRHVRYQPNNPLGSAIRDFYRFLDEQVGKILERVDDRTAVFVVSDHGAQRLDGGLCINEWLMREGYLCLSEQPKSVASFDEVKVDWRKTKAWGEGGYYGRLFINLQGREPQGIVPPAQYEALRDELIHKLESLKDENGKPLGNRVYRPQDLYPVVNGVAPDLVALFGNLCWRSVGSVGGDRIYVQENDTGPDDANHSMNGIFIAANVRALRGPQGDLQLMNMAPTTLELLGLPVPADLEGRSILS